MSNGDSVGIFMLVEAMVRKCRLYGPSAFRISAGNLNRKLKNVIRGLFLSGVFGGSK